MRWRALAQMRFRPGGTCALVHDPSSGSAAMEWPSGTHVLQADSVLSDADVDATNEWAYAASLQLVRGRGRDLFPELLGVHFGDLVLAAMQTYLVDYARLRLAVRRAVEETGPRTVRIFSADRSLARTLAADTALLVPDSQPVLVGRPEWLRRVWRSDGFRVSDADRAAAARARVRAALATLSPEARRPRVLVISESTPMAQMFAPVETELRGAGVGPVLRLQYSTLAGGGAAARAPHTIVVDRPEVTPPPDRARYARRFEKIVGRVREAETSWGLGIEGGPVPLQYAIEGQYLQGFDYLAEHIRFADALLEETRPELVVVGNDRYWVGQTFVRLARARGLRTACVQDGVVTMVPLWFWKTADLVAANSTLLPDLLTAHGVAAGDCVVTGQARYDGFFRRLPPPPREDAQRRMGIDPALCWALFATQPVQDVAYQRQVIDAILSVPGAGVIVRPHPSQDTVPLRAVMRDCPSGRVSWQAEPPIFDVLSAADMVVVQFSTVAIEAAILERPVITANFSGVPDPVPYARYGLSAAARTPADIASHVAAVVEARRRGETAALSRVTAEGLERLVGPVDGRSTERTVAALAELLHD
jgi:hypothetical protein